MVQKIFTMEILMFRSGCNNHPANILFVGLFD